MTKVRTGFVLCWPGMLMAIACSGDSAAGGGGGISIDALPAELAKTMCARAYECCMKADLMSDTLAGPDEASCRTNLGGLLGIGFGQQKQSIAKMRLAYHADQAGACLAAIKSATCAELEADQGPTGSASCNAIFEPKVPAGGACSGDSECIGGGQCDGYDSSTKTDGKCTPVKGTGDKCDFSSDCGDAAYCDATGHTCMPRKADGAMCASDSECTSDQCTMGMCMKKPSSGKCFISSSCAVGPGPTTPLGAALALGTASLLGAAAARRRRRAR